MSTKEKIMETAAELFGEKGFHATSVREIVEAAGVKKPALYYYFKNKQDLGEEIIRSSFEFYNEQIMKIEKSNATFREILKNIVMLNFVFLQKFPHKTKFFYIIFFGPANHPLRKFFDNHNECCMGAFDELFKRQFKNYKPTKESLDFHLFGFLGLINIFRMAYLGDMIKSVDEKLADKIVKLFLEGAFSGKAK